MSKPILPVIQTKNSSWVKKGELRVIIGIKQQADATGHRVTIAGLTGFTPVTNCNFDRCFKNINPGDIVKGEILAVNPGPPEELSDPLSFEVTAPERPKSIFSKAVDYIKSNKVSFIGLALLVLFLWFFAPPLCRMFTDGTISKGMEDAWAQWTKTSEKQPETKDTKPPTGQDSGGPQTGSNGNVTTQHSVTNIVQMLGTNVMVVDRIINNVPTNGIIIQISGTNISNSGNVGSTIITHVYGTNVPLIQKVAVEQNRPKHHKVTWGEAGIILGPKDTATIQLTNGTNGPKISHQGGTVHVWNGLDYIKVGNESEDQQAKVWFSDWK